MPVYNGAEYLQESLNSVLDQTMPDWELILVDDGSTDESGRVYQAYKDPRIRVVRQENKGVAYSRNVGLGLARAPFIACLDADDVWRRDKLEIQRNRIQSDEQISLLGSYCDVTDAIGNKIYTYRRIPTTDAAIRAYFLRGNPFVTSSVVFGRENALKVGGFRDERCTGYSEDFPLWKRLSAFGTVCNIAEALVIHRIVPGSLSSGGGGWEMRTLVLALGNNAMVSPKQRARFAKLRATQRSEADPIFDYHYSLAKLSVFEGATRGATYVYLKAAWKFGRKRVVLSTLFFACLLPARLRVALKSAAISLRSLADRLRRSIRAN